MELGDSVHRKYCEKCNEWYENPKYNYCPKCATELINNCYWIIEIFNKLPKHHVSKCENCDEHFPKEYKICPYCKNKLERAELFYIDWDTDEIASKFMDFSYSVIFEDLYEYYFLSNSDSTSCVSPPEQELYESTLSFIRSYHVSDAFNSCKNNHGKFNSKFRYCPYCGEELVDERLSKALDFANNLCNSQKIKRCEKCQENFSLDFQYCPICSNLLKEMPQFWFDEENKLIKTYWNDKEISQSIFELYDDYRKVKDCDDCPMPINIVSLVLVFKEEYDYELEESFYKNGLEIPKKLTCREMGKLVSDVWNLRMINNCFMNSEMIFNSFGMNVGELKVKKPEISVIKLRKDLFYLYECKGRVLLG